MDIVDAQVHLFMTMDETQALVAMDALGIQSMMIDEAWAMSFGSTEGINPAYELPNGVRRHISPGGVMAALRYPDRFSWLRRMHPDDPDLGNQISQVKDAPGGRAIRLDANPPSEARAAAEGARMDYFRVVAKQGVPLFLMSPGHVPAYERYIRAFPDMPIALDHCGFPQQIEEFDQVLAMAAYPNVYLKWAHAPTVFRSQQHPFPEVTPHLKRAIDAFGPNRIMWASDISAVPFASQHLKRNPPYSWGEALFSVRDNPELSDGDKEWILGRTARTFLDWPAPKA